MMSFITLAERLYRALLMFYPAEYRREYGTPMVQVFRDVSRAAYHKRGLVGLVRWWYATVFDLIRTVIEQRREARMPTRSRSNLAAAISLLLCLPFFLVSISAIYGLEEPPFVSALTGRLVMLGMFVSLPAAFIINFAAMFGRSKPERAAAFRRPPAYILTGASLLLAVLMTFWGGVRYELRPFVTPLGSSAIVGQILFLLGLLALPAAFLLLPAKAGFGSRLAFQPTSINLIIGAVILLVILMLVSTFLLETIACSSGVPNCD